MTKQKMTMDFDYLNYVTSTKLKKVNDKTVEPIWMCGQNNTRKQIYVTKTKHMPKM